MRNGKHKKKIHRILTNILFRQIWIYERIDNSRRRKFRLRLLPLLLESPQLV